VKTEADSNDVTEHPYDDKSRPYLCTVCDKRYRIKQHLISHMNIHTGKYKCTECGACFQSSAKLTEHSRVHSGEKPFECSVCSKRFADAANLVQHSRIHTGEKPHKCPVCGMAFIQSGNLKHHMRKHTGERPYKCYMCEWQFSVAASLRRHMSVHSGDKPSSRRRKVHTDKFKCTECGKCLQDSTALTVHSLIHSEEKRFECNVCSKRFTNAGNLVNHSKIHVTLNRHVRMHKLDKLYRGTDGPCTTECDSGDWSAEVRQENLPVVKQEPDDTHVCCTCHL